MIYGLQNWILLRKFHETDDLWLSRKLHNIDPSKKVSQDWCTIWILLRKFHNTNDLWLSRSFTPLVLPRSCTVLIFVTFSKNKLFLHPRVSCIVKQTLLIALQGWGEGGGFCTHIWWWDFAWNVFPLRLGCTQSCWQDFFCLCLCACVCVCVHECL